MSFDSLSRIYLSDYAPRTPSAALRQQQRALQTNRGAEYRIEIETSCAAAGETNPVREFSVRLIPVE
jgi:hypothetical protein